MKPDMSFPESRGDVTLDFGPFSIGSFETFAVGARDAHQRPLRSSNGTTHQVAGS